MCMCLQLCIDHDSISLVASIPSIPQGFGLSSDVIFAKVVHVYIHTSLSPIGAYVGLCKGDVVTQILYRADREDV